MCHIRALTSLRKVLSAYFPECDGQFDLARVKEPDSLKIVICCCAGGGSAAAGSGHGGVKEADGS
jgi:uncharacterized protein (UPF0262 family)